jgi:hypothetical protein
MSSEKQKTPLDRVDRRFQGNVRHYHRKGAETSWDDWTGVKAKGPKRQQFDRVVLRATILIVGALIICSTLMFLYIVMKKLLSASPN